MHDYTGRLARLQEAMQAQGANLAVFGATDNMRYLTGWAEYGHERLVGLFVPAQGDPAFLVPMMNAQQAESNPAGISNVVGWDDGTGWHGDFTALAQRWKLPPDGLTLVDDELYSRHLLGLQAIRPDAKYCSANAVMTGLREIKTPEELEAMAAAARLIDVICEEALAELREGMTERELQEVIYASFKQHATRPAFTPLICFGANASMPHHSSGDTTLKRGDIVIIDIGCLADGYPSDITRTVSFGEPADADAARVYEIVNAAHWAAREAARPGVTGAEVDAVARKVITDAGYGPQFIHRTGHGIGLSTHEPPDIVSSNHQPLKPGNCFSIEPGIYLPGRFGIRIENIVTMTNDGVRSFNADAPRRLRIVGA